MPQKNGFKNSFSLLFCFVVLVCPDCILEAVTCSRMRCSVYELVSTSIITFCLNPPGIGDSGTKLNNINVILCHLN